MNKHPEIKKYMDQNNPPRVLVRYIMAVPEEIKSSVNDILKISRPNAATLKQLIELASDINSRHGTNPLDDKDMIDLIRDSGIKEAVKKLRRIRMPKLNKLIFEINNEIKAAGLKMLSIDLDQSFESSGIMISANISSVKDAETAKEELSRIISSGSLERITKKYMQGI
jgi:hypothetical protein